MGVTARTGIGFDAHRFDPGRELVLGGVRIPHDRGLAGHSDGDAVLHAIADALLGAAVLGDLGQLFPPGDPAWKDADSRDLLGRVAEAVGDAGFRVTHVDVTVLAEEPRIAPHVEGMRRATADALGVDPGRVSVKATTTEGMGFLGRGEGIAALATATVVEDGGRERR